jgi:hypothetical protein
MWRSILIRHKINKNLPLKNMIYFKNQKRAKQAEFCLCNLNLFEYRPIKYIAKNVKLPPYKNCSTKEFFNTRTLQISINYQCIIDIFKQYCKVASKKFHDITKRPINTNGTTIDDTYDVNFLNRGIFHFSKTANLTLSNHKKVTYGIHL